MGAATKCEFIKATQRSVCSEETHEHMSERISERWSSHEQDKEQQKNILTLHTYWQLPVV